MSNDRHFQTDTDIATRVEARNVFRAPFGLQPVDLERERASAQQLKENHQLAKWLAHPLRSRVETKLLQRLRRRIGNPDWTPTGILSGGGLAFHVKVTQRMQKLRRRLGDDWLDRHHEPRSEAKSSCSFELL